MHVLAVNLIAIQTHENVVYEGAFGRMSSQFVYAGWNIWEILDAASYAPPPFRHLGRDGRVMIQRMMNQAVDSGLTVVCDCCELRNIVVTFKLMCLNRIE